jgi:hypothetical protein
MLAEDRRVFAEVVRAHAETPLREQVASVCRAFVRRHLADRALYRQVLPAVSMVERTDEVRAVLASIVAGFADVLRGTSELGERDPEQVAFVTVHALRGALMALVLDGPDDPDEDAVVEAMADMAWAAIAA